MKKKERRKEKRLLELSPKLVPNIYILDSVRQITELLLGFLRDGVSCVWSRDAIYIWRPVYLLIKLVCSRAYLSYTPDTRLSFLYTNTMSRPTIQTLTKFELPAITLKMRAFPRVLTPSCREEILPGKRIFNYCF